MSAPVGSAQALEPLRVALLAAAGAEAAGIEGAAEQEGRELLASAERERDALLQQARERGAVDGALQARSEGARLRREARGVVLAAQREAYDELRRRATAAVRQLLDEPAELERLASAVRLRLGPGATVRAHPAGGLVGESADGRAVDASVDALVDTALATLDLPSLWAPS